MPDVRFTQYHTEDRQEARRARREVEWAESRAVFARFLGAEEDVTV